MLALKICGLRKMFGGVISFIVEGFLYITLFSIIIICKIYWPVFSVTLFSSVKIEIQSFDRIWFLILTFM